MAWKATLKDVKKQGGRAVLTIEYSDGAETFQEQIGVDATGLADDWLSQITDIRIKRIEGVYTFVDSLPKGLVAAYIAPAKSQNDIEKTEYFEALRKLQALKAASDVGGIDENLKAIADLEVQVKGLAKPEYFT